jgi:membrane protein involved in colicin uptake
LTQNYKDVCHDLKREQIAGRETQKQAEERERQFKQLQQRVVGALLNYYSKEGSSAKRSIGRQFVRFGID